MNFFLMVSFITFWKTLSRIQLFSELKLVFDTEIYVYVYEASK